MSDPISTNDEQLLTTVRALIDGGSYPDAHALLKQRIAQGLSTASPRERLFAADLAGLLIDAGAEGKLAAAVTEGIALLKTHQADLEGFVAPASMEYNLANAKGALADINAPADGSLGAASAHEWLVEAKNHYWRAFKLHLFADDFGCQLRTNLGTTLRKSGRITEALAVYESVFASDPGFAMAHLQRGYALLSLEHVSCRPTASLLYHALNEFAQAADAKALWPAAREHAAEMSEHVTKRLTRRGYTIAELRDNTATYTEAAQHSAYRRFTLEHHLGLAEHSLYCNCNGARRDDLMIATHATPVEGKLVPRLEMILNRLKAEFGTARFLYYQALHDTSWEAYDHEITYAQLFEGEELGIRIELLRTSFRLCLGVLDKIALGVCELFDVADPNEKLYFESFWRPKRAKGNAARRWSTLASKENPGLIGLYSQAADVRSDGEWATFKAWRNDLEHRFLILTNEPSPDDPWNAPLRANIDETVLLVVITE
jgi:hypothetical protein